MKIQTKISILLFMLAAIFISGIILLQYRDVQRAGFFFKNTLQDKMFLFERVVLLEGASLETFVNDYSSREEIISFMENELKGAIRFIIDNALQSFNVDAVWIYRPDFSLLHTNNILQDTRLTQLPLPENDMKQLFLNRGYYRHFFIKSPAGLLEIRSAPIHIKTENEESASPRGFLFAARVWTQQYTDNLGSITESTITIKPLLTDTLLPSAYAPWQQGKLTFFKILEAWDRSPLIQIQVCYDSFAIRQANRSFTWQLALLLVFVASILVFLSLSLLIWVRRPLKLLSQAMEAQDTSALKNIQSHTTEFGRFARLLIDFLKQKSDLVHEINERLRADKELNKTNSQLRAREEELEATNEELMAQEEQLQAANKQLQESNRQLRKGEEALRESEKRYRDLVDTMNEGLAIVDMVGRFTYINERFSKMLKCPRSEIIGNLATSYLTAESRTVLHEQVLLPEQIDMRLRGEDTSFNLTWRGSDGEEVVTIVSPKSVFNQAGTATGSFSVITDITNIKNAEKAIREYKEFLEKIIEGSQDGIIIADGQGKIISINKALTEILGLKKEAFLGKPIHLIFNNEEQEKIYKMVHEKPAHKTLIFEAQHIRPDGASIEMENNFTLIVDDKGDSLGGIAILRDITERIKFERQLVQSEKLRSLGQLASGVAHDFNNVLAAIIGRVQILGKILIAPAGISEKRKIIKAIQENLAVIEKAAMDGAETVHRIQQFSRTRQDDLFFTEVDLPGVITDALKFTRVRWKNEAESKGKAIEIKKHLTEVSPVTGSASELREVITNLINNAIDAMPRGGSISLKSFMKGALVVFEICDTGSGIPPEIQEKVFEPFFTTKGPQATGLGMSISYGIIKRHNGTISIDSTEGRGTTFTITLPGVKAGVIKEAKQTLSMPFQPACILVIEDEDTVRDTLCEMLREFGHAAESAANGTDGLKKFHEQKFDMVFTDLGMPEVSGFEVAKHIKQDDPSLPVILITGWELSLNDPEVKASGVDLVLHKPFQMQQLMLLVQSFLDRR